MSTYSEPMVARVIGVNKSRVASMRKFKLSRPADWELENAVVVYTEAGLKNLLAALGLRAGDFAWPAPEASDTPQVQFVARIEAIDGAEQATESTGAMLEKIHEGVARLEAVDAARPVVKLTVTRISRNQTILYAATVEGGEVPVKVSSNVNFVPEMTIEARPYGHVYFFEGRCPRCKGRF